MMIEIKEKEMQEACELLRQSGLPSDDISAATKLYAHNEDGKTVGLVGLETYDNAGLLRSLSVSPDSRKKGLGSEMVDFIEREAKSQDIFDIYLLTTTASMFFQKKGYQVISREMVPQPVRESSQFSTVCPSTAILMHKKLAK